MFFSLHRLKNLNIFGFILRSQMQMFIFQDKIHIYPTHFKFCEIKFMFYGKTRKIVSTLWPRLSPLPHIMLSTLRFNQNSPIGRNTFSAIKSNILLYQQDNYLKHFFLILLEAIKMLRSGLYKLSMIGHLMHSPSSQKTYI